MKVCNHCGSPNEDSSRFCTGCGAQLPEVETPEPEPSPSPDTYYQPTMAPEYAYQPTMNTIEDKSYSALAITGFVISLVSIFCCGITAGIGLIFSIAGTIAASKKNKKGMGFAITGLVINLLLTLFIILSVAVSWAAIEAAYEQADDGDIDEFFSVLEEELERMEDEQSGGRSSGRSSRSGSADIDDDIDDDNDGFISGDWADLEVSSDYSSVTVTYTDGIPDDFEFFDAEFEDICDALEDNIVLTDSFGVDHEFDSEEFNRLLTMVLMSPSEYENMNLSRSQLVDTMACLATISFEMYHDGFVPDRAVYIEETNVYEFYGVIAPNSLGRAVVVFTDGTNSYEFDDAMCGDEICWAVDFDSLNTYHIGLSSDTLEDYPAGGFSEFTALTESVIDSVV